MTRAKAARVRLMLVETHLVLICRWLIDVLLLPVKIGLGSIMETWNICRTPCRLHKVAMLPFGAGVEQERSAFDVVIAAKLADLPW
jgi:hypothetical protein